MKYLIVLLAIPFLSLTIDHDKELFVGEWEGTMDNRLGKFIFDKEGYVMFGEIDDIGGGKNFNWDGQTGNMTYEIIPSEDDFIHVDIVITLDGTEKFPKRMLGIAKFVDQNTMDFSLQRFKSAGRPLDFESGNYVRLTRVFEKID